MWFGLDGHLQSWYQNFHFREIIFELFLRGWSNLSIPDRGYLIGFADYDSNALSDDVCEWPEIIIIPSTRQTVSRMYT